MKIGFFDSGMGGLSVLQEAMCLLPEEQFLYYADEKHVPYGEKTKEEVIDYVEEAVQFMVKQGIKAIVIACNTATSVAISHLRQEYDFPIIGMEPAVKQAIDTYGDKRVLATATPITVRGEKMRCLIERVDKQHLVDLVPLPKLVRFAENEHFDSSEVESYLRQEFSRFSLDEYASVVLGCTHFNYFKDSLRNVLPESIHFVDGNGGTIRHLKEELKKRDLLEKQPQEVSYYYSGERVTDTKELARIARYMQRLERMYQIQ
ncbi:MAG: glutamate racemase [Lachnospiraceae bacterium]